MKQIDCPTDRQAMQQLSMAIHQLKLLMKVQKGKNYSPQTFQRHSAYQKRAILMPNNQMLKSILNSLINWTKKKRSQASMRLVFGGKTY